MNSKTPSIHARKAELLRSFLNQVPGRVSAILENWHHLVHSDWDEQLLASLLERLHTLCEAAGKFGVNQIHQNGRSLESTLREYSRSGSKPQHDDVVAMDGLVHAFRDATIQACKLRMPPVVSSKPAGDPQEPAPTGERTIILLGMDDGQANTLTRILHNQQLRVETVSNAQDVFEYQRKNPRTLCALVSHTRWLAELFPESKEGGLWQKQSGLPDMPVAFIADSAELQTRLTAMRTHAKAFWSQPIDPNVVASRMQELTSPAGHSPDRVLIVEDDPSQADFASSILSKANFECRSVTDPLKLMDVLYDFHPDLILMDLYMPGASGTELTTVIREQSEFVDTPIVFLSGEQDLDKQLKALSFGGEDFLAKPIGPKHLISTVTNRIQRARQLTHRLGEFNRSDDETGLFTRHYLLERLETLLQAGPCENGIPAVFYLDVDNADEILRAVGIGGMDVVLAEIGNHLGQFLKQQDVLSRFGDHSLGLLLCRDSHDALEAFGRKLCDEAAGRNIKVDNHTLNATLSIGAFPIEEGNQDARALFSRAKLACKTAQKNGTSQIYLQRPQSKPGTSIETDKAFTQLIMDSIEKDYFEIYFQPIVALKGGSEAHYQTLLRLQEPDGKLFAARDFIPKAEQLGLISRIDHWTTRTALTVINEHKMQGDRLHLFVSQSTDLLENMERLSWLQEKHRHGLIQENDLTFEFKLSEVARNPGSARICFDMLRNIGITTLLTGVNNSAESQHTLSPLPISYIKLDSELLKNPDAGLKDIISLAHSLQVKVIAPQVEEPRSIATLWSSGTDFIQGNFVQRPENNLIYDFNESILN